MATREIDLERKAAEALPPKQRSLFERTDRRVAGFLDRYGVLALRIALGVVYIWFGALKVVDRSPVEQLVRDTVFFLPDGQYIVYVMGAWEIVIGLGLLFPVALRLTLAMLWVQLVGTMLALVVVPGQCFQDNNPLLLTATGEFVVKNLVLASAGLVIGSTVRGRRSNSDKENRAELLGYGMKDFCRSYDAIGDHSEVGSVSL
jgi:putative oxidoreductase